MELNGLNFTLTFDESGNTVSLENKLTEEVYHICDSGEFILTGDERVGSGELVRTNVEDTSIEFVYENLTVRYEVKKSYIEKTVTFTAPKPMLIDQVGVLDWTFPDASDIHFHDDCTIWHCPLCTYARYEKGGVYYGLAYPYWDSETAMSFSPWVTLEEGETFVSENVFIGTFEKTGKIISSHGPYPGERKQKYYDMFKPEKTGLNQHFKDFKIPEDVGIPEEEQDAGEIAAMREFFRDYLGENPLPEDGYFVWQNGWWAGLNKADRTYIDIMERIGVKDLLTAAMYFGHASHPSCEPNYIKDVLFDPLRFPKVTDKKVEITILADGHHHRETADTDTAVEYTEEFSAPEKYDDMIRYGKEKGINVTSFSTPNNAYVNYPEWVDGIQGRQASRIFGHKVVLPRVQGFHGSPFRDDLRSSR